MKTFTKHIVTALLCICLLMSLAACTPAAQSPSDSTASPTASASSSSDTQETQLPALWQTATYTEDKELGEGSKTVAVEIKAEDKAITVTLHTDAETLGDALLEHELIAGDESEYGLYVKAVNGIKADYDTDKAYWAFYQNGEYMNTGVDGTNITGGEHYELVYTKG
mgnify:CR=1 FL=1